MKKLGVGLVGCGVVGGGFVRHLSANRDLLTERSGCELEVRKVAVRDLKKDRGLDPSQLTTKWQEVVHDADVDIVVELMGGTDLAFDVVKAALKAEKPVVTANKALLAERGEELLDLAIAKKVPLLFEASVAGGIPIVKALSEGLRANRILKMHGIINGTCNYILTRMENEGLPFEDVLAQAKELGYAEADESLDVDGIDAAHKAAILASLAYGFWVKFEHVYVEGIRNIDPLDVEFARKLGYSVKLLAIIKPNPNNAIEVRVHPTLIPENHVLSSISGVYNAVAVEGDVVGSTLFYGRGAGADPTASAVLADVSEAASYRVNQFSRNVFSAHNLYGKVVTVDEIQTRYYIRLTVMNRPGVLAEVAAVFGRNEVGISSVVQPEEHDGETVPLVMLMDQAKESVFQKAYEEIQALEVVKSPCQLIRVEELE